MTSDPSSWREAKPPYNPGPIWNFRRGYRVEEAGRHETDQQFRAFQFYMHMGAGRTYAETARIAEVAELTVQTWADKFNWQRRAAKWDQKQMALALKDANKLERQKHRQAIEEFRASNEEQARLMMDVSSDLMNIIQARIKKAEDRDEEIPMGLVSGLLRAAANISDTGRQAWATSLGVNELMQVVEQELEQVSVEDVTEDVYDIPLDE